ncbi:thermonuclease family protein [Variovorax dokdonensis]|uniref:Thermonuclease family protein n=1 Tax=Variovorax dokdonensis TaxID=344883 RepID=A0ABT7N7B1_9BURK|nr:thermonuclease family protein [Variovorax dokdonensis]MDM0043824.1 thermonuclease family protein [Variovorax dokdonensis]
MSVFAAALFCVVIAVSDGDTLKARCDSEAEVQTVRLAGIDAPEYRQPFGRRSRQKLADLALERPARLECQTRDDRYGRRVCRVWVAPSHCRDGDDAKVCPQTLDAGHAMLTVGLAWWDERFAHTQPPEMRSAYAHSQQEAQARQAGLWSDSDAVPPWLWRQFHPSVYGRSR